eukprot:m.343255 g.343255  ORF g.343255 m.343255 type:complete len:338 (-) comp22566_c0_seq1:29-1042(-)
MSMIASCTSHAFLVLLLSVATQSNFVLSLSSYKLSDVWQGETFFNGWDFYTTQDPTHGCVDFVSRDEAQHDGLIWTTSSQAGMKADNTTVVASCGQGRKSIRISSQKTYNGGLFVLDLEHMPFGCGTWPAWWSTGPSWPQNGEIDVVEGVNLNTWDQTTLHTTTGCSFSNLSHYNFTGHWGSGSNGKPASNCDIHAPGQYGNQGCGIISNDASSYGAGLNKAGGGVFAHEWSNKGIRMWWWRKGTVPASITSGNPDPNTFGEPYAAFPFGDWCPASHFQDHSLIFDLTICGDWAGAVFAASCSHTGTSCNDYVLKNPSSMNEAFWLINSVKVYQMSN